MADGHPTGLGCARPVPATGGPLAGGSAPRPARRVPMSAATPEAAVRRYLEWLDDPDSLVDDEAVDREHIAQYTDVGLSEWSGCFHVD